MPHLSPKIMQHNSCFPIAAESDLTTDGCVNPLNRDKTATAKPKPLVIPI